MSYHKELVVISDEDGEQDIVFRSLRRCLHCARWEGGSRLHAYCQEIKAITGRDITTCSKFVATEEGRLQMWIETKARQDDEYSRIYYKGKPYFVEKDRLISLIGWDPDKE